MELLLGAHESVAGPKGLLGAVEQTISDGGNCFMVYLTTPQSSVRRDINSFEVEAAQTLMKEAGINQEHCIVHAPYIINPAYHPDANRRAFCISFLKSEIERAARLGFSCLVLHPGSHGGLGAKEGVATLAETLNEVLADEKTNVRIAIETMSGKGREIGISLDDFVVLFGLLKYPERVGVCLDTCHLHDGGLDLNDFDAFLDTFDILIGLDKVLVVHLNDSNNERGSHKDRHANIGLGKIGFEALNNVLRSSRLAHVPKILETPFVNDASPYELEIKALRAGLNPATQW